MKTMKYNIFKACAFMMMLGSFSACNFLEEMPATSLYNTSVYATEAALEAGIIGCYGSMQSGAGWQGEFTEYLQHASGLIRPFLQVGSIRATAFMRGLMPFSSLRGV